MTDRTWPGEPITIPPLPASTPIANLEEVLDQIDHRVFPSSWQKLLQSMFAHSPFLAQSASKEQAFLSHIMEVGFDIAADQFLKGLTDDCLACSETPALMSLLRQSKRQVALLCGLADISGWWQQSRVTRVLNDFANLAVDQAVIHLVWQRMQSGDLAWPNGIETLPTADLATQCGFFVLAMGKMGAGELNYSSDVDLICFYDADNAPYQGRKSIQDCYVRLTRELVKVLQERTGDGYVFRVDLRLRPDAGSTPPAISTDAAEIYYQSLGMNWERSAMIKARVVAGDFNAGEVFLSQLEPFVWRKNLDFAALEDIRNMKNRIHEHHGHTAITVAGQDVKLGLGGIREIEFLVQSQQLISGGRNPALRDNRTQVMLTILAEHDHLDPEVAIQLNNAYDYLRTLEHRLQMVRDEQTHTMPTAEKDVDRIAHFMGYENPAVFRQETLEVLQFVHAQFTGLFPEEEINEETTPLQSALSGGASDDDTRAIVSSLGFADADKVLSIIERWRGPHYRACRSERAQALLEELLPTILEALAGTSLPDHALLRFDEFLASLPTGIQMFALFQSNPNLINLLATIVGSAPVLADMIGRNSALFDAVLDSGFFDRLPSREELSEDLDRTMTTARDLQDVLDFARRWVHERQFQIGVKTLQGAISADEAYNGHTLLAELSLSSLYPAVEEAFSEQHGRLADSGLVTIAMGSFGGLETSLTSDLDMIFVYEVPDLEQPSDGRRPLMASQYFARLSQRYINAITSQTSEGRLYEVDMRLRPSGNAGPIALTLDAFDEYQQNRAWTWEHMALTRARVIAGPQALQHKVTEAIQGALCNQRDPESLLRDVASMRLRLAKEFSSDNPWKLKHHRGGLVDIEFICQYLQLLHAFQNPDVLHPSTQLSLANLQQSGCIDTSDAGLLISAHQYMSTVRAFMRQCIGADLGPDDIESRDMRQTLADATGSQTIDELKDRVYALQENVREIYTRVIQQPADTLPQENEVEQE
jgi:glutamate-ammonia-ligase adenylyltransferase